MYLSLSLCTHIYIYTHVCIYIYILTCMCIYIYIYTHTNVFIVLLFLCISLFGLSGRTRRLSGTCALQNTTIIRMIAKFMIVIIVIIIAINYYHYDYYDYDSWPLSLVTRLEFRRATLLLLTLLVLLSLLLFKCWAREEEVEKAGVHEAG